MGWETEYLAVRRRTCKFFNTTKKNRHLVFNSTKAKERIFC